MKVYKQSRVSSHTSVIRLLLTPLAILTSRQEVWHSVRSRRHEVRQAFICDQDELEFGLILTGVVEIEKMYGQKQTHEFLVRVDITNSASMSPRIQRYQVLIPVPRGQISILD